MILGTFVEEDLPNPRSTRDSLAPWIDTEQSQDAIGLFRRSVAPSHPFDLVVSLEPWPRLEP
jgi:hypothetical protein